MSFVKEQGVICKRYPCEFKEGKIWRVIGARAEEYNLMDFDGRLGQPALYSIFASLDENDPEKINQFCNRFGLLGLKQSAAWKADKIKRDGKKSLMIDDTLLLAKKGDGLLFGDYSELIIDIKREILTMRFVLEAIYCIGTTNEPQLIKNICKIQRLRSSDALDSIDDIDIRKEAKDFNVFYEARDTLLNLINNYIADISPTLEFNYYTNKLISGWGIKSLLAGMYLLLFNELSRGLLVKHCQNETCRNYFPTSAAKMDAKYCSPECARAQASREYRRRKKKKQADKVSDQN